MQNIIYLTPVLLGGLSYYLLESHLKRPYLWLKGREDGLALLSSALLIGGGLFCAAQLIWQNS
ncbi:hypothetical protein PEDI_52000 [Persicobacter diffluens]|uniref:Uncharacterized protein n=1 Tax=Persicobacter diffluens TaxID=981 RepID=A0AAN5AQA0_9BACT|nr:hypothetical protein PEDI_52000 [Persicobacter diffluens]